MSLDDDSFRWDAPGAAAALDATAAAQPGLEESPGGAGLGIGAPPELMDEPPQATAPAPDRGAMRRPTRDVDADTSADRCSLAGKVEALRTLEDDIGVLLAEAEAGLRALEADGTLEDAGFRSADDFRERVAARMGLLHEMREAPRKARSQAPRTRKRVRARTRRGAGDMRARRTRALSSIEQAMARFHDLDAEVRGKVEEARGLLSAIEGGETFAECGYATFDEFLDLAIGPSHVLTRCLAVGGALRPPETGISSGGAQLGEGDLPSFADPPVARPSDDRPPALFELPAEPPSVEESPAPPEGKPLPAKASRSLGSQRSILAVSIALGIAAAVLGTLAGVRASRAASASAPAVAAAAPSPQPEAQAEDAPHHAEPAQGKDVRRDHGPSSLSVAHAPGPSLHRGPDERLATSPAPAGH